MVFGNLCLAEVVDFFRMPAFCKEVKEITGEKFCIRVGNHICPLPFDIDEYRVRQTGDFLHCPVFEDGTAAHGNFQNISFFVGNGRRTIGQGFFQERIINRLTFQQFRCDISYGGSEGKRCEVMEVTCHFQNEERPRNGSADTGGKESDHGNDNNVWQVEGG